MPATNDTLTPARLARVYSDLYAASVTPSQAVTVRGEEGCGFAIHSMEDDRQTGILRVRFSLAGWSGGPGKTIIVGKRGAIVAAYPTV